MPDHQINYLVCINRDNYLMLKPCFALTLNNSIACHKWRTCQLAIPRFLFAAILRRPERLLLCVAEAA